MLSSVVVLAVALTASTGHTYPVLKAREGLEEYKNFGFPALIIIDQDGKVHDVHIGYSKTLRADVGKIIEDLLAHGPKAKTTAAR